MKNIEQYNFKYKGCEIKFYERPFDYDIDIIFSKGNLRKRYQLNNLIQFREYRTVMGTLVWHVEDKTEKTIMQFKELVIKGELELL